MNRNGLGELAMAVLRQYFKRPQPLQPLSPELAAIPEVQQECLAVYGFFHMVGVDNDDISMGVCMRDPKDGMGLDLIVVAKMLPRSMVIRVTPLPEGVDLDVLQAGWEKTVEIWNAAQLADKTRLIEQSHVYEDFPDFFVVASSQGLIFPTTIDLLARLSSAQYQGPRN